MTQSGESEIECMKEIIAGNLVRFRKGVLSQEKLANLAGVTRQSINNYENARTLPDSKTLSVLARVLDVSLDDLLRPVGTTVPNFWFRIQTNFDRKPQFVAQVLRLLEDYTALEQAVGVPTYAPESTACHHLEGNEKRIAEVATQFRHRLGVGDAPIPNLFEAVEEIGLKVLRQDIPLPGFFGLSAYSLKQGAFVLVNSYNISIEWQLFTLAHEIGHLILHRDQYQDSLVDEGTQVEEKAREAAADHFASHLLVSQIGLDRALNLFNSLIPLKTHFRVSHSMMLKRLDQMGKINYGEVIKKIRADYKRRTGKTFPKEAELEPVLSAANFPVNQRFTTLVWEALAQDKVSELQAAELLNLTIKELRQRRQAAKVYAIDVSLRSA